MLIHLLLTNQMVLSLNINILEGYIYFCCKTKLRLRVYDRQGKHSFVQDHFYFQGIFSYITERDTSSPDCKHKHTGMLENGAPTNIFGVLYHLFYLELSHFGSWYYLNFFVQKVWVPLILKNKKETFFLCHIPVTARYL